MNANQLMLFGEITATGNGWVIKPRKPVLEVTAGEAASLLGISRSSLYRILDTEEGAMIQWRWMTPARGKMLFERESLMAYRNATMDPEFGSRR